MLSQIGLGLAILSAGIWVGLLLLRGKFWQCDQVLTDDSLPTPSHPEAELDLWPTVCIVIPARNEAEVLPHSLRSLLLQDYPGSFHIFLVDDHSTDGTSEVARAIAKQVGNSAQLHLLSALPLPPGWTGKLWALDQGVQKALVFRPDYLLLTDADIQHDPGNLRRLVAKAEAEQRELVSLMVRLRCDSLWEKLLIPAFVFFFQKLYPFAWVNDPSHTMAGAAGGCSLIRRSAMERIGGIQCIRQALIDDCALAQAIKSTAAPTSGKTWLGLTPSTFSLRPYPSLKSIWDMVARTAFTQLNYSPWLLAGTLIGMALVYLVAPLAVGGGILLGNLALVLAGLAGWGLMTLAYYPTVRFYDRSPLWAVSLPAIALLYNLMTLDSALRHWQGKGGAWKGRVYEIKGEG